MTTVMVAGAGIAGLTTAITLADAGLAVSLVERTPELVEAGAGIQLSPNATRILRRLGLLDQIATTAVRPAAIRIRRARDGADLARIPLGDHAEARYAAPFLVTHRADLQAVLLDAARSRAHITITTGATLDRFDTKRDRVEVALRTGATMRTETIDGLVGADGLRSPVRQSWGLGAADAAAFCGRTAWRSLVPADAAPAFARTADSNLWLGPKTHLVHYPVRGGTLINLVAIVEDDWQGESAADLWAVPGDPDRLLARFGGWSREARALLTTAETWRVWPLFDRPPLKAWSRGPVAVAGDAAHPMLPFLAQGAAQAIEDGWALGAAVRRYPGRLAEAFAAYGAARRGKAARVQREARRQGMIYHLGGPAAALRDLGFGALGGGRLLSRYDWLYGDEPTLS